MYLSLTIDCARSWEEATHPSQRGNRVLGKARHAPQVEAAGGVVGEKLLPQRADLRPEGFGLRPTRVRHCYRDRLLVYVQSDVAVILFHRLPSLILAVGLRDKAGLCFVLCSFPGPVSSKTWSSRGAPLKACFAKRNGRRLSVGEVADP